VNLKTLRTRPETCLSDLRLYELASRELDAENEGSARAHLATCALCAPRLASLEAMRDHDPLPEPAFRRRPSARAAPAARYGRVLQISAVAAFASAALFALVRRPDLVVDHPSDESEIRIKGGERIGIFVKSKNGNVRESGPNAHVAPGDQMRFTYTRDRPGHLAIIGIDARRRASVYVAEGPRAVPIEAGRDVPLTQAIELDETLGRENVWALFCDTAIEIEPVRLAFERTNDANDANEIKIPEGCVSDRVTLIKELAKDNAR
jgi:hypothetical protein